MIAIVVPVKDGKFLMVKHPERGWEFPGGRVEVNETAEEAAIRECREEAGVEIENLRIIKKEENMVVFAGNIKEIKGGEMRWKLFSQIPQNLSFSRDEVEEFLRLARLKI